MFIQFEEKQSYTYYPAGDFFGFWASKKALHLVGKYMENTWLRSSLPQYHMVYLPVYV